MALDICHVCNKPLDSNRYWDGEGFIHHQCFREARHVQDVINGMGDPELAKAVLSEFFAKFPEWHGVIITEFNRRIAELRESSEGTIQ